MSARICSRLPNLPLFHKLEGRKAVVVGSSDGAVWKAELLAAAGAESSSRRAMCWTPARFRRTRPSPSPIFPIARKHCASSPRRMRRARVVNVIDQTDLCDVTVRDDRQPLANRRRHLDRRRRADARPVDPRPHRRRAAAGPFRRGRRRPKPGGRGSSGRLPSFGDRRAFWQRFAATAWAEPDRASDGQRFRRTDRSRRRPTAGRVTLVGAGPGDPELLTLKAVRALQSATVILYDRSGRSGRARARPTRGAPGPGRQERARPVLQAVRDQRDDRRACPAGENVVRLKGGDPLIFGRATEEIDACRAAGVRSLGHSGHFCRAGRGRIAAGCR